ncbi:hypothetical protein B0H17DRAFT_1147882 [Mycena rosella]|uniref:Uncharacterized protein n=1 Tax=Mycena rosella TaxID=1033263 RepID=A0AAD7CHF6_MYCRO|nr:hypothetical protein B0H17DRAFT_1147882 [Mycena rosella]
MRQPEWYIRVEEDLVYGHSSRQSARDTRWDRCGPSTVNGGLQTVKCEHLGTTGGYTEVVGDSADGTSLEELSSDRGTEKYMYVQGIGFRRDTRSGTMRIWEQKRVRKAGGVNAEYLCEEIDALRGIPRGYKVRHNAGLGAEAGTWWGRQAGGVGVSRAPRVDSDSESRRESFP